MNAAAPPRGDVVQIAALWLLYRGGLLFVVL